MLLAVLLTSGVLAAGRVALSQIGDEATSCASS
jgi:hypothetical protein